MNLSPDLIPALRALVDTLKKQHDVFDEAIEAVDDAFYNAETPSQEPEVTTACEKLLAEVAQLGAAYERVAVALDACGGQVVLFDVPITAACIRLEASVAHLLSEHSAKRAEVWGDIADELEPER